MPLYEYYCENCDGVFEALRSMREASEPSPCPLCDRDALRIMPTSFAARTFRDGTTRSIPDRGTYWHLGKEVKQPIRGEGVAWEHPEINKPTPAPVISRGDQEDVAEYQRIKERHIAEVRESGEVVPMGRDGKPAIEPPGVRKPALAD